MGVKKVVALFQKAGRAECNNSRNFIINGQKNKRGCTMIIQWLKRK